MGHSLVTGIVTRCVDYKDNDRILTIFTRERGRIDAKARGCRRAKSPLLPACQPFVFGEFQLFSAKGDQYLIDQCDMRESFYGIREDIQRLCAGTCMLSLAQTAIQPEEPNERLFSLLYYGLSFLCYGQASPLDLTLCFILRYLDAIGFCPAITQCASCAKDLRREKEMRFSPAAGGAVCQTCGFGALPVAPLTLEAMRRMLLLEDGQMQRVHLPEAVQQELLQALTAYCAHVLERDYKAIDLFKQFYTGVSKK